MSSCLVTGGAGFIGSSIAGALLRRGDRVRIIDDFSTGKRSNLADMAGPVELIEGDIRDGAALARALDGIEIVFHEAAIASVAFSMADPVAVHETNAGGTLGLLQAARRAGTRRVVYAASSAAYGDSPVLPKVETMATAPLSPYAASKLAGELYCQVFAAAYGLETVCLRYFNVFGPRQDPASEYAAVIPRFVAAALAGGGVTIYGDGTQSRDFCFIDDVVDANLRAAAAPGAAGGVFNVATGAAVTLNELVGALGKLLSRPIPITYAPRRAGDVLHSRADVSAARERLGFEAATPFLVGLQKTVAWFTAARAA
jgi:UDP-glucose 4-epimerase